MHRHFMTYDDSFERGCNMPEILLGYVRSIYVDQLGRDTLYSMIIMVMPIVPQLVSKLESYWLGYNGVRVN